MDRSISRRDFLNGAAAVTAVAAIPGGILAGPSEAAEAATVGYPPGRTGLRGSHPGSYEVAHRLARQRRPDWGRVRDAESDVYDLVVVGAGISGLSAAHFYRKEHPDARILILDNHDDFGGHAKRNEFELDGRTILSYAGSQTLENPSSYSGITQGLLQDLGIDTKRFETAYDQEFYRRNGLAGATYFDCETFGSDRLVGYPLIDYTLFLPLAASSLDVRDAAAELPRLSRAAHGSHRRGSLRGLSGIDSRFYGQHRSLFRTRPHELHRFPGTAGDGSDRLQRRGRALHFSQSVRARLSLLLSRPLSSTRTYCSTTGERGRNWASGSSRLPGPTTQFRCSTSRSVWVVTRFRRIRRNRSSCTWSVSP